MAVLFQGLLPGIIKKFLIEAKLAVTTSLFSMDCFFLQRDVEWLTGQK